TKIDNNIPGVNPTTDKLSEAPKQQGKYIISKNHKELKQLEKYKWWLQYETPEAVLSEVLKNKDSLNMKNPTVSVLFETKQPGVEKRALCFIESNDRTYMEMTYYDTSVPRDQTFIKDEVSTCVKRDLSYYTLDTFKNKSFTITDFNIAKHKATMDKKKNSCAYERAYVLDSWKYNMVKTPKLKKNQKFLTIIDKTADCEAFHVEYYIGEKVTAPTISKKVTL
ncbi:MAG: hypothetical protein WCQ47_03155, partial [bacterium]